MRKLVIVALIAGAAARLSAQPGTSDFVIYGEPVISDGTRPGQKQVQVSLGNRTDHSQGHWVFSVTGVYKDAQGRPFDGPTAEGHAFDFIGKGGSKRVKFLVQFPTTQGEPEYYRVVPVESK